MRTLHSIKILIGSIIISLSLGVGLAFADPPEHAPAHGYYKNKGHDYDNDDHDNRYKKPSRYNDDHPANRNDYSRDRRDNHETLSCDQSSFSRSDIGSVIGGILGGILGSNIGKGNGKTLATIAGVIVGASIGNNIGTSMDEADRYCAGQALGNAQDNQTVAWKNPDTQRQYTVTPERSYTRDNGRQCRSYTSTVVIDGRQEQATGTACKDYSGNWQIIN